MSPIWISVVIPLFNKVNSIKRAIFSVLSQNHSNFELIIVDDGSTDSSLDYVREFSDERIRIISQPNQGVSAARNRGISESNFGYIAFLDADDEWDCNFLEEIAHLIEVYPNCAFFASSYRIVDNENNIILSTIPSTQDILFIEDVFEVLRLYYPFNSSSVVIRKDLLIKVGGFPLEVFAGEDVVTWLKAGMQSKILLLNKPLSLYHHDAENRASKRLLPDRTYAPVLFLQNMLEKNEIPIKYRFSVIEFMAKHQLSAAKKSLREKKTIPAIRILWQSRKTRKQKKLWLKLVIFSVLIHVVPGLENRI